MLSLFEQLSSIGKTNLDVAQKFASTSSELTERLIKAQVDAATQLLDGSPVPGFFHDGPVLSALHPLA